MEGGIERPASGLEIGSCPKAVPNFQKKSKLQNRNVEVWTRVGILLFGFLILEFGFRIVVVSVNFAAAPDPAVWILDFWFWIWDFGVLVEDLGFLVFGFWISEFNAYFFNF